MEHTVNQITLRGTLLSLPHFSHENHGKRFYRFTLEVPRLSGAADVLPVMVSEEILDTAVAAGDSLAVTGQIRTFNSRGIAGRRLLISVYAETLEVCSGLPENEVLLTGALCKPPVYRSTPFGREICDMMLAVNRAFGKSDYIPCIAWGRNAQYASRFHVGDRVHMTGRLQSREYQKLLESGEYITRNAFEVSAFTLDGESQRPFVPRMDMPVQMIQPVQPGLMN